jgi:hypothetical protein
MTRDGGQGDESWGCIHELKFPNSIVQFHPRTVY